MPGRSARADLHDGRKWKHVRIGARTNFANKRSMMIDSLRNIGKQWAGGVLASGGGARFTFARSVFLLAHMRCGSTAMSNIICSHPQISGYGEAHIRYGGREALGLLAINQMRRGEWKPKATYLFDKILHDRYHREVPAAFFSSRGIFLLREPEPTIRSIVNLFQVIGKAGYNSHIEAANYYAERLETLASLWDRFAPEQRIGLTHRSLLFAPDEALAAISARIGLVPPLTNHYRSPKASLLGGGGDPLESGKQNRIEPALLRPMGNLRALGLPEDLTLACETAFARMHTRIAKDWPDLAAI